MRWDLLDDASLRFHSPLAPGEPGLYEERMRAFRAPARAAAPGSQDEWLETGGEWEDTLPD